MRPPAISILFCAALAFGQQAAPPNQKKADPKAEPKKDAAQPKQQPAPPAEPRERRQTNYTYDVNGRPVSAPSSDEQRRGTGASGVVDRSDYLRDPSGNPVRVRSAEERVLSQRDGNQTSERVVQRFDPSGKPTGKQVIKTERRQMPDGSTVSVETTYETDLNGRLELTERRTTTERKTGAGSTAQTVTEKPGINSALQVIEQIDRVETKRSEAVTEAVSSRKRVDANGRLAEQNRELSIATKSGSQTNTDTQQWQLGPTGQMDFVSRSLSRLTETPGGNQTEDVEVYATKIGGTTPDLNRPQEPTLEQKIHREKKVQPDGKSVEKTTAQMRQVADPSRLGALMVTEQVTTPTTDGKTIQRTVSERDYNGRMVKVRSEVEEEKK